MGMITDRDICMAVATKHRVASEIAVWEAISGDLYVCHPDDYVRYALKTMKDQRVRRLPVVNEEGVLQGMLSINDLITHAEEPQGKKTPELSYEEVMSTLKAICAHRVPIGV
jgi:signal-transduction protein with cAMP-binding, CBS, and nucleotidyltransferase domain